MSRIEHDITFHQECSARGCKQKSKGDHLPEELREATELNIVTLAMLQFEL
jgi:hypothetical protein